MTPQRSTPPAARQRSTMENFLDEYQRIRLLLAVAGLSLIAVFLFGGWWQDISPIPNLTALTLMAGHAAWCRLRHIRAPRSMLLMDITLLGWVMTTIPDHTSVMTGTFAFLGLLVVLFLKGWWMIGLLVYAAGWYATAFLVGAGVAPDSVGNLAGSTLAIVAIVVVMARVVAWLGRLDADRSQMVGTVSHELRNSLTGVVGLTEVVGTMSDLEPAEARELVAMAHQQAIDANDIVEDLLTASRLEGAALTVSSNLVDVNTEVANTVRRFQGTGSKIELALDADLPSCWADALRVRQTVRNMLSNAIRYGGPEVTVATALSNTGVQIIVSDNGDGVPLEDENSIFLPYRRSTHGRRDAASIGLGLWICRHLAHAMKGHLDYRRHLGLTQFVLTIPVATPEQDPDAGPIVSHPPSGRTTTDQPDLTHLIPFAPTV